MSSNDVQNGTGYKLPTKTDKRAEQHQSASVFVSNNFSLAISGLYRISFGVAKPVIICPPARVQAWPFMLPSSAFLPKEAYRLKNAINKKT